MNVKTRIGMKDAKTICVVSVVPESQPSPCSYATEAHASTSAAVLTGTETSDSSTVHATLNVTVETEEAGM